MNLPKGNYYVRNVEKYCSNQETRIVSFDNMTSNNLYNGDEWDYYRLSDTVRGKNFNITREGIRTKWPNTLIDLFLDKVPERQNPNKMSILASIITEKFPIQISEPYVAIHLRLGDRFGRWNYPVSFFDKFELSQFTCHNIILFCGLHNRHSMQESLLYVQEASSILEKKGFNVILRCGNSPDDDFVLMCKANYFITASNAGGYSELISDVRKQLLEKDS